MSQKQQLKSVSRREFLKLTAALGAGAVGATVAACAPVMPAPQMASGAQPAEAPVVEIEFWDMVWGPPEYIDTGKKLIDQFNQQHPNIKVTYQSTPWSNWYQTFLTAIGAGVAPDISTGAGYQAVQFYSQGAILPIDDVIADLKASGEAEDFQPGTIDRLQYDGHYVALPWGIDIRMWFYRKDLLEAAGVQVPTTWDEFREACKRLTKADGSQYGFVGSAAETGGQHLMFSLMFNNGGGLFTPDRKLEVMNERNVEACTFLANLVADGSVHPGSAGFKNDDARKAFGTGNAAILLAGPGEEKRYPDIIDKIGMTSPLAALHGDKGTISWVNNIMLYKQGEHPEETKEFLKWWSANQKPIWTEGHSGQIPARRSIASDPYFQNDVLVKKAIDEWVPIGQSTGARYTGIFPELNDIEGDGTMVTLSQDLLQGKDVTESMQKAEEGFKRIMGEQ